MSITIYSFLLALALGLSAPWWLWRMATTGRYREGLGQRLGRVPPALLDAVRGRRVVWVHAVSVGELLAAETLVRELGPALQTKIGGEWLVVVSTTTATGQKIARQRLGSDRVFYLPLDFARPVRRYLRALRPELLVLMENELWPRLLTECNRARVPVALVNARVSDRSFAQPAWRHRLWRPMLRKVSLFLAQGEETAARLRDMGAPPATILVAGNLKYDIPAPGANAMASLIAGLMAGRPVVVAGSTLPGEEAILLAAWSAVLQQLPDAVLIIAPRHPPRFAEVARIIAASGLPWASASRLAAEQPSVADGFVLELDTLGDLAAVYGVAGAAFVGGSLVPLGGHNPLEAARFGLPILMGPSYQNFREMVDAMLAADALRIVDADALADALTQLLRDDGGMGARARSFFKSRTGATARTLQALLQLLEERA